jgi:HEAT repeat protein
MNPRLLTDGQMRSFLANGVVNVQPALPASYHRAIYEAFDKIVPDDHVEHPGKAKPNNPGNNIIPLMPQLAELFEDPAVKGALISLLGADHMLDPHRALHNNMPIDGPQPLHKDSLFAFKRHVRTHRPWTLLLFYYPQETPPERGPTGVIPGSQYALRHPGGDASSAFPLGGPAGTVAIGAFDVWHARMRNFTNQKRFMLKFLMSRMTLPTAPSWDCADDRWRDPEDAPQHYPLSPLWRGSWNWLAGKSMPAEATGSESLAELEARLEGDDESLSLSAAYELAGRGPAGIASLGRRLLAGTGDNLPEDETTAELGGRYAEDPAARAAAFGLGASDPAAAGPILAEATRSSSGVVRKMAAFALGEMRGDAARDAALVRAAGDSDPHVRITALAAMGRHCAANGFVPSLRQGLADPEDEIRVQSALAFVRCATPGDESLVDIAQAQLRDTNRYVVAYGAETLERIGTPRAMRVLLPFLKTARWCHFTKSGESIY